MGTATFAKSLFFIRKTKGACKRYTKNFNITKLGEDEAFRQAQAWLAQKRKEFNYV